MIFAIFALLFERFSRRDFVPPQNDRWRAFRMTERQDARTPERKMTERQSARTKDDGKTDDRQENDKENVEERYI